MNQEIRFYAKVRKTPSCWIWTGAISPTGYGKFRYGGRGSTTAHAHRMAWLLTGQAIPDGLYVLHQCDNRRCVRPDHLFLGTAKDNAVDCKIKGRNNRGDDHPMAKLTVHDVKAIRSSLSAGARGIDLAAAYNVTAAMISSIRLRKSWVHI